MSLKLAHWTFKSYLAQFICQQISQQKSVGGVSHQVAIFAHDFDFFYLISIIGLQDHPRSCREVPHYHLEQKEEKIKSQVAKEANMQEKDDRLHYFLIIFHFYE